MWAMTSPRYGPVAGWFKPGARTVCGIMAYLLNDGTDAGMATRMLREPVDLAAVDAHRSATSGAAFNEFIGDGDEQLVRTAVD